MKTLVLDIQKCSIHDGPGIRTTVFLKGCPLSCKWCHNPESQEFKSQLRYLKEKCIGCGQCETVCKNKVHTVTESMHDVAFKDCIGCGACVKVCANNALEQVGTPMSIENVMNVIREDRPFYRKSKGGVTISGGEPLSHPEFVGELLRACKDEGIHTCIETSGFGSLKVLGDLVDNVDLFLLDYKITGEAAHQLYTGVSYEPIKQTMDFLQERGKEVILRCPIIPQVNDEREHFEAIQKLKQTYDNVSEVEIMPYHKLGVSKAAQVGMSQYCYEEPINERVQNWKSIVK